MRLFGDRITGGLNLLLPTRCSRCQPLQDYIRWKKINKLMALSLFGVHSWFPAVVQWKSSTADEAYFSISPG